MLRISRFFARDDDGVTAIEYGLIAALVAVVVIGASTLIGSNLSSVFGTVASHLSSSASSG